VIALVGLAGTANASATINLIWQSTGTDTISGLSISDTIILDVMLVSGALGSSGAQVSVDYSALVGTLSVTSSSNTSDGLNGFTWFLGVFPPSDSGGIVHGINYASSCGAFGDCLGDPSLWLGGPPVGGGFTEARLGTITFQVDALPGGTLSMVAILEPLDGIATVAGGDACVGGCTFNSGFAVVPEPGTLSLLGMGLGGLYVVGRRSSRKR
jgi:hypothetical protein